MTRLLTLLIITGTLWNYQCINMDFSVDYGFKNGKVYLVEDSGNTVFPNKNGQYAYYSDNYAVMYQYESPIMWGLMISDFNKKKAVEYLAPFFLPILRFDLELVGDFSG